ncbi:glycosyltransferase [Algoriphagus sp.]|uniref:glycosyltransferase n=1 Tax=Algoriphagus sp. TaxID=1872435 RepID=UPI0025C29B6D|nr:glycosyltransferase [Algoriphagus sp.]
MIRFGGFIITYNRPNILLETIEKLFEQTFPPELIWVIDNSDNLKTDYAIAGLLDNRINYFRMGYNAGPAGAAKKGLELCAAEGLDWIFWGDDNDPPFFNDTFEKLLSIRDENPFCGIIGAVGHFFDRKKGVVKRIQSRLLEKKEFVEVDFVAGGMSMLVSAELVNAGVLPNEDLFFGFEELDFCLKASRKGFIILAHCKIFLDLRKLHNRTDYERPNYKKKQNPSREYYSLRNLLMISDTLTLKSMRSRLVKKWFAKSIYGFKYGLGYGFQNAKMIFLAFHHYHKGIKGKTIDL